MGVNVGRVWPSYGFRLGFGYLELSLEPGTGVPSYILTEADGTKRKLADVLFQNSSGSFFITPIFQSDDSSYINYDSNAKVLTYKNGLQIRYQPFVSSKFSS